MAKHAKRRSGQSQPQSQSRPRRKHRIGGASLVFVGLLLLAAALIGVASLFDGDVPDCPRGQVWSADHGHCH